MTDHSLRRTLLRRPLRRRVILAIVVGAIVGSITWYFGMDTAHAIALGLITATAGICLAVVPDHSPVGWDIDHAHDATGMRRDVTQLSWALAARSGSIAPSADRRIRALAQHVLARHGLNVDDPADSAAIERAIGTAAWAVVRPGERALPRIAAVDLALSALDKLDASDPVKPPPTSRSAHAR